MKTQINVMTGLCCVMTLLTGSVAIAQSGGPFTLDWHSRDGGGGPCSGGVTVTGGSKFVLAGTAGQPDAGVGTAGAYTLQGGFTPGFIKAVGPSLMMTRQGTDLKFTWPAGCTGFVLQGAANADDALWDSLGSGTVNAGQYQLRLHWPLAYRFFGLRKDCPR